MLIRWFVFRTRIGELLLIFLERKIGLAVVECTDPMKLDTFGADFSEHQEVVHAHAAIVPRTRPE